MLFRKYNLFIRHKLISISLQSTTYRLTDTALNSSKQYKQIFSSRNVSVIILISLTSITKLNHEALKNIDRNNKLKDQTLSKTKEYEKLDPILGNNTLRYIEMKKVEI